MQTIQGLSLMGVENLKELRLKRNKIEWLDDGAFWPLKNLTILQLDFNLLTKVRKGGLFGLERLQKLTLSHNRIKTIETQSWELCKEIVELLVTLLPYATNLLRRSLILNLSSGICRTMR